MNFRKKPLIYLILTLAISFTAYSAIYSQSLETRISLKTTPSILFVEDEKFPPFFVNNHQLMFINQASFRFTFGRLIFGAGVHYQVRKIRQNCVFMPGPDDLYPSPHPFISNNKCSHIARGNNQFLDIPILLGWTFFKKEKYDIYALGTWSPFSQYWQKISFTENIAQAQEGRTLRGEGSYFLERTPTSLSLGFAYKFNDKLQFFAEPTFYVDHLEFKTINQLYFAGLGLGASWKL